jgi:hypothetical protein
LLRHRDDRHRNVDPVDVADEGSEETQQYYRMSPLPARLVFRDCRINAALPAAVGEAVNVLRIGMGFQSGRAGKWKSDLAPWNNAFHGFSD